MKLAVFTSLNPVRSGISDYAEALLPQLERHFEIEVFTDDYEAKGFGERSAITIRNWREYRQHEFGATLYNVGNNPYHIYMYDLVLQQPGVVTLHEFNLHHLIADSTIRRGHWDAYLKEAEYNGGEKALAHARRVQAQEVPPDYEGLPMNRRVLESSRALIVHSRYMVDQVRRAGYQGPVCMIPHGVRIPEVNRYEWRARLDIDESTPLIGTFGFIRPHKRIGECLLAMKRLVRTEPRAKMIVVGEEHPHFPVREFIAQLGLEDHVRVLGYVPLEELEGWISAVDICLNLRYPTVGETSGTLSRALGLGRAVIVSDVGSFSELPNDICLKVPVGESEEHLPIGHRPFRLDEICLHTPKRAEVDLLTDFLALLTSRPDVAKAMGARARSYVADQWNWSRVADMYAGWIHEMADEKADIHAQPVAANAFSEATVAVGAREVPATAVAVEEAVREETDAAHVNGAAPSHAVDLGAINPRSPSTNGILDPGPMEDAQSELSPSELRAHILSFCGRKEDLEYVNKHLARLVRTLQLTPLGGSEDRILEMGAYLHITPALKSKLGYGEVRGSYLGPAGTTDHREARSYDGEVFACDIDLFDAEKDRYPYPDEHFSTIVCCELLEHLSGDPMHLMAEINRVLQPGGHLVLSTPNICSYRAAQAVLLGYHPGLFHQYVVPDESGTADPRHSREYAPRDVQLLFEAAGFELTRLETGPYYERSDAEFEWLRHLMDRYNLPDILRGDVIHAVGKKAGSVKDRHPAFLYVGSPE